MSDKPNKWELEKVDKEAGRYGYFYDIHDHDNRNEKSMTIAAVVDAAATMSGDPKMRMDMFHKGGYYQTTPVQYPTQAMARIREIFAKMRKRVDALGDLKLALVLKNIYAALSDIVMATTHDSSSSGRKEMTKYFTKALEKMKFAEQEAMKAFYESVKDEEAVAMEKFEKTTISLQLAIFLKILIPSFRFDDDDLDICLYGIFDECDEPKYIIAQQLKELVDDLLDIQSQLKAKQLVPPNGTRRENTGKFEELLEFVKKIVYPYFIWGFVEYQKDDHTDTLKGNLAREGIRKGSKLKIVPKYLGRGRAAASEVNIGKFGSDNSYSSRGSLDELTPLKTNRWGSKMETITIKLWREKSAIVGTTIGIPGREEQLVLYHPVNNNDKEIQIDLEEALRNKMNVNPRREEKSMIFLGGNPNLESEDMDDDNVDDVVEIVMGTGTDDNNPLITVTSSPEEGEEDNPKPEIHNIGPIKLVPKDLPTCTEESFPIYTNIWVNVEGKQDEKPPHAVAQYLAERFPNPKIENHDEDEDDYDSDDEIDYKDTWPFKPVVVNIWRGEKALLGTVCGVLAYIQPFKNASDEITLDVQAIRRYCDWEDLTNEEITPGVKINLKYLGTGFESRCPIIMGDLPTHKEILEGFPEWKEEMKKRNRPFGSSLIDENEDRDDDSIGKEFKNYTFWPGFLYSECTELVVEIWKEDGNILGIIRGTDNVVIREHYAMKKPINTHVNLTLKESLALKPQSLGEFIRVSSSAGDRGGHLDVCGLYVQQSDGLYGNLNSEYCIHYDDNKKWCIRNQRFHKLRHHSQNRFPPIMGWKVTDYCPDSSWNTAAWLPAPQITVRSLGTNQIRTPEEILALNYISVAVRGLPLDRGARLPVNLEIDEEDVSAIQKALDYNFWAGWMAGGGRRLEMKVWVENGFVIATYENSAQVVFHQRLQDEDREIFISFDRLRPLPLLLGKRRQKQFSTAAENAQEIVKFECNGNAGSANEYCQDFIGTYIKTDQIIQGCPVFLLEVSPVFKVYLFVGPNGCWRVGPDVTTDSGSVLKNPQKHKKIPPESGWLFYYRKRSHPEWFEDDSLKLIADKEVEVSDECEKEDNECDKKTKEDVKSAFDKADTEGTGNLTRDQLKTALGELIESGHSVSFISDREMLDDDVTMRMFIEVADRDYRDYDYHNDEPVNLNDLLIIMELGDEKLDYKEMFTKLVNAADKNWNGLITVEKLRFALVVCGFSEDGFSEFMAMSDLVCDKRLTNEEVVDILTTEPKEEDSDENKDGKLNYTEFCDILRILMKIRMEN